MAQQDHFKKSFKYFKSKPKNMQGIINFELESDNKNVVSFSKKPETISSHNCSLCSNLGLINHQEWHMYALRSLEGFFFIKNPFTVKGQQYWIRKCLEVYPRKPSVTNLDLHHKNIDDIWSDSRSHSVPDKCKLINKLTWSTLGYHYDWDNKVYNPERHSPFPNSLAELVKHIASCFGFQTFQPDTAIVNYYGMKSRLAIHNDHSEEALNEPIVSISFGQSAVFLVGTSSKTEKPEAIFLRSGDVVILSGQCRLSYHAVPIIIQEPVHDRNYISGDEDEDWKPFDDYIEAHRINLSVRQVYNDKSE